MTLKQRNEREMRLAQLREGGFRDRVCAILMDSDIGGHGLHEDVARAKADVLADLLLAVSWKDVRGPA